MEKAQQKAHKARVPGSLLCSSKKERKKKEEKKYRKVRNSHDYKEKVRKGVTHIAT